MSRSPGTVLRTLRELSGLTASEVAERANVSESYLIRVESGEVTPTDAWLGFVASILSDALIESPPATPPHLPARPGED
jgi:transcriptional regulator with XRE-family HTH domain